MGLQLRLMLQFEYEIRDNKRLNLYCRAEGDILELLEQVPYEGDLESSIINAVETGFKKRGHILESNAIINAIDLTGKNHVKYST